MVGQPGLEPGTSVLSGLRSNRLSYWPTFTDEGDETALPRREREYIFSPKTVSRRVLSGVPKNEFHNHVALRVRWSECDAQGIIYYGRYMDYVEIGLAEYFRNLGHRLYDETQRAYFDTATVKITMEYRAPVRVDEMLEVYTRVSRIGTTSLVTETEIYREGEEELLTRAETVYVDFDSASGAPGRCRTSSDFS